MLQPVITGVCDADKAHELVADAYVRLERIARMMLAQGAPGRPELE